MKRTVNITAYSMLDMCVRDTTVDVNNNIWFVIDLFDPLMLRIVCSVLQQQTPDAVDGELSKEDADAAKEVHHIRLRFAP